MGKNQSPPFHPGMEGGSSAYIQQLICLPGRPPACFSRWGGNDSTSLDLFSHLSTQIPAHGPQQITPAVYASFPPTVFGCACIFGFFLRSPCSVQQRVPAAAMTTVACAPRLIGSCPEMCSHTNGVRNQSDEKSSAHQHSFRPFWRATSSVYIFIFSLYRRCFP